MAGKKNRLHIILIALTTILASLFSQGTLAYYVTTGTATNVVTSGDIGVKIVEKTSDGKDFPEEGVYVMPQTVVSKIVTVANTGSHPFWLRVKLTDGVSKAPLSSDIFEIDINEENWIHGKDGFYYYKSEVAPGAVTEKLFSQVRIAGTVGNSYANKKVSLVVNAYAVQSENNGAASPLEVAGWPAEG